MLLRAARILAGILVAAAVIVGTALIGLTATAHDMHRNATVAAGETWPAPRPVPDGHIRVAVALGNTGSVVTDVLAPYEVFARSSAMHVYAVAADRSPHSLTGGLPMLPEYTFSDAPDPDVIVIPAVASPTGADEAPLRDWIVRQRDRGARILGVCAGSAVLAEAGVLNGLRATSFWQRVDGLAADYPRVNWIKGQRYVQDGRITTTAGVTSGTVGALRLVEELVGPAEASRIRSEVDYPQWSLDIAVQTISATDYPYAINALFPWGRPTIGVGLVDGVGEIDLAAAFELYGATSSAARTLALADHRLVTSAHGATFVAAPISSAPRLDRVIVPSATTIPPAFAAVEAPLLLPQRTEGEFGFDPMLRDLAQQVDRATAVTAAKYTEYPIGHLSLSGPALPWRSTILAALTLLLGVAAGVLTTFALGRGRRVFSLTRREE